MEGRGRTNLTIFQQCDRVNESKHIHFVKKENPIDSYAFQRNPTERIGGMREIAFVRVMND